MATQPLLTPPPCAHTRLSSTHTAGRSPGRLAPAPPGHPAWPPCLPHCPPLPRAHGGRPQEPSFFRRFEDTHAPPPLSEEDALNDRLGPSRHLGGRRPLQDS